MQKNDQLSGLFFSLVKQQTTNVILFGKTRLKEKTL